MKRRTMNYLRESGRTESEQKICWHTGIICLFLGNPIEPWRNFEVGAFSPSIVTARFHPFLIGFEPNELPGLLA